MQEASSSDAGNEMPAGPSLAQTNSIGLRIILAAMVAMCLVWTVWLLVLNIAPNSTVNRIMDTGNLDSGSFWLFVDPPLPIYRLAIVGLSSVALGYVFILVKLVMKQSYTTKISPTLPNTLLKAVTTASTSRRATRSLTSAASLAASFVASESASRRRINLCTKFVDWAIETIMLIQILEDGSPVVLTAIFTTIVVSNAIGCALMMFLPYNQTALLEHFIDLIFDMLIAVGYPTLAVCRCLSTFNFDRKKQAINLQVFPPGWYEQSAAAIANPVQTVIIYKTLGSLRINSVFSFFTRLGINITLWLKLRWAFVFIQNPLKQRGSDHVYPKRHRVAAATLVIFAALLIVYVEESIRISSIACQPHPECIIKARRWMMVDSSSLSQCSCLALIDNDIAPKTYAEWINPRNVTDKVADLAAMGSLQIMQTTNRNFPVLPEEIRNCKSLRYVSLVYTHTQTLPGWVKELTKLEYLHIEGTPAIGLVDLPDDMFYGM